jgi:hypothetical protein
MPTAPIRTVSKARNETTRDISRLLKKKRGLVILWRRKTTTNTRNIITDRCPGVETGLGKRAVLPNSPKSMMEEFLCPHMPSTHHTRRLEAPILSRMRSPVTSRSNWANDSSTLTVSRPIGRGRIETAVARSDCVQVSRPDGLFGGARLAESVDASQSG